MESKQKQLLEDVRALDGIPGPMLKSRIYQTYQTDSSVADWDFYPAWSFHPRFLSPVVQSELVVYDGPAIGLLRCAPGFHLSRANRPEMYRTLLVPERLGPLASSLAGVSDVHVVPASVSGEERVSWIEKTFQDQSYERIVNLSPGPGGAWLASLVGDVASSNRHEGLFLSGVKPVVKTGPALYLYFRTQRWDRVLPVRHGPFEAMLFGAVDYKSNRGIALPEEATHAAHDFHRGLNHPDRSLVILAPKPDLDQSTALRWAQLAGHLLDEEQREVVVFADRSKSSELVKLIERETRGRASFANRWLSTDSERAALVGEAGGVVAGDPVAAQFALRMEVPLIYRGETRNDLLNPGDIRLDPEETLPTPVALSRLYHELIEPAGSEPKAEAFSVEREDREGDRFLAVLRRDPPAPQTADFVCNAVLRDCEYRLCYILNNLVRLEIPTLDKASVVRRYQARFGDTVDREVIRQVLNELRGSLSSLEKKVMPEIKGIDPSPPETMTAQEEMWFGMFQPLWAYRSVADGEQKDGQIAWGVRYFFSGCRSIFQALEKM